MERAALDVDLRQREVTGARGANRGLRYGDETHNWLTAHTIKRSFSA
jgi:hypothetical protein